MMHLVPIVLLHAIFSLVSSESSSNESVNHTLNLSLEYSEEDSSDIVNSNDINVRRGVHIYQPTPFDNGGGIKQAQVTPMRPSPHYPLVPHNPFVRDPNRHPNAFSPQFLDNPTSQLGPNIHPLPYNPYYPYSKPPKNNYGPQVPFPVKQPPQNRKPGLIPQTELYIPPVSNSYPKESIKQPLPQTQDLVKPLPLTRESFPFDQGPDQFRYEQNEPPQPDPNRVPLPPGPLTTDPSPYLPVYDVNQPTPIIQPLPNPSLQLNKPSGRLPDSPLQGPDRYVQEPIQLDLNKSQPPGRYFPKQELLNPPIDPNEPSYFAPQNPNPPPPPPKGLDLRDPYPHADDQPLAHPNQNYPESHENSLPPIDSPYYIPDIDPNAPPAAPQYTNSPRPIPTQQTVELFPLPSNTGVKQPTLLPPYTLSPEDGPYPPIENPNWPISIEPFPIRTQSEPNELQGNRPPIGDQDEDGPYPPIENPNWPISIEPFPIRTQSEPNELQGNRPLIGDQDEDDLTTLRDSLDELDEELLDPADSYLPDPDSRDNYPPSEDLYNPEPGSFYPFRFLLDRPVPYPFPRESYTSRLYPPIEDLNNPRSPSIFPGHNQVPHPNIPNTNIYVQIDINPQIHLTLPRRRRQNQVMMLPYC